MKNIIGLACVGGMMGVIIIDQIIINKQQREIAKKKLEIAHLEFTNELRKMMVDIQDAHIKTLEKKKIKVVEDKE